MKPQRVPDSIEPKGILAHLEQLNKVTTNISFGDTMGNSDRSQNMECWKSSGNAPGVANTEFAVAHGLGRIPITLAGQDTNNGGVIYRGATAWTTTQIFLKCTTAAAAYNIVII